MTEALLLVVVGSLVPVSVATLVVGVLALRKAQLYVELVEQRLESLREGQVLLLTLLRDKAQVAEEEQEHRIPDRERQERERLALAVRARRKAGRGIGEPDARPRRPRGHPGARTPKKESGEDSAGPREQTPEKARGTGGSPRAANFPDTTSSRSAEGALGRRNEASRGVAPAPDDDVSPARANKTGDATVEMFRRHYDKYLENYEGYVKLAARLQRMRDDAEAIPGSLAESEWEARLRRVTDGIQRTTARLDILEEYNPELATDDRISRRAAIARSHRE